MAFASANNCAGDIGLVFSGWEILSYDSSFATSGIAPEEERMDFELAPENRTLRNPAIRTQVADYC